jgi:hypothetical protein
MTVSGMITVGPLLVLQLHPASKSHATIALLQNIPQA